MVNQLPQFVRRHIKLLAALALIICAVLLYCVNPVGHTFVPKCTFKLINGYDCPGCGAQRAIHALLHGRLSEALSYNYFMVYSVPYLMAVLYTEYAVKGKRQWRLRHIFEGKTAITLYIVLFVAWGIVRNVL